MVKEAATDGQFEELAERTDNGALDRSAPLSGCGLASSWEDKGELVVEFIIKFRNNTAIAWLKSSENYF